MAWSQIKARVGGQTKVVMGSYCIYCSQTMFINMYVNRTQTKTGVGARLRLAWSQTKAGVGIRLRYV